MFKAVSAGWSGWLFVMLSASFSALGAEPAPAESRIVPATVDPSSLIRPSPTPRAFFDRILYPDEAQPQAAEPAPRASPLPAPENASELGETRARRGQTSAFGLLTYSPIDLIIPSKIGATIGLVSDASATWELEYVRGTVGVPFLIEEIGEYKDERLSLIRRSYFGNNSFNLNYGLSYYRFTLNLGNDVLSRASGGAIPASARFLETESIGFNIGIGNRWILGENFVVSCDWISWSQPLATMSKQNAFLAYASNAQDRKNADDAVNFMSKFPRLVLFKLQVGITF